MKIFPLLLISIMAMFGCSSKPPTLWVAKEKIEVYKKPDEWREIKFFLNPGDVCAPGKRVESKASVHTEIVCTTGTGWVFNRVGAFEVKTVPEK
jgi:hypothetical protein